MKNVFIISDTHFGDTDMCEIVINGKKLRPWSDVSEHDESIIANWNSVVKPNDKIYHLGDVCINRKSFELLNRLNGSKILIRGNHDIFKLKDYLPYFRDIRGMHVMNGCLFTHAPVHESCLGRFGCNIHGHTHMNSVFRRAETGGPELDPSYYNVSLEFTNFSPINLDELYEKIKQRGGTVGFLEKNRFNFDDLYD